jgi:hypothetical protein
MAESDALEPVRKKRGRKPILDPERVAAAIVAAKGNLAAVARRFGVARRSVHNLVAKRPALQRIVADVREGMLDEAEASLHKAVRKGEQWAVCFYLKNLGRSRGYGETKPIENTEQVELQIQRVIVVADEEDQNQNEVRSLPPAD